MTKEKVLVFAAQCGAVLALVAVVLWIGWGYVSAPIVQKETDTGTVVAVITHDGVVHHPSYFEDVRGGYDIEWVAPGYRPAKYGVKEWELKDLKE